jgi:hypothetical protein
MRYENIREVPAEGFGLDWHARPGWAWPTNGAQKAIEVRVAERDVAGRAESGRRMMKVYSVYTDQGFYWAMTGTDGTWRLRNDHAF